MVKFINNDENLNIFDPRGRLHRLKFSLIVFIIYILKNFIYIDANTLSSNELLPYSISVILMYYIYICTLLKRLNDINSSRWLVLLDLVPVANLVFEIYLFLKPANYKNENL